MNYIISVLSRFPRYISFLFLHCKSNNFKNTLPVIFKKQRKRTILTRSTYVSKYLRFPRVPCSLPCFVILSYLLVLCIRNDLFRIRSQILYIFNKLSVFSFWHGSGFETNDSEFGFRKKVGIQPDPD